MKYCSVYSKLLNHYRVKLMCNLELASLLWWWGRGFNLSLTWDQPI